MTIAVSFSGYAQVDELNNGLLRIVIDIDPALPDAENIFIAGTLIRKALQQKRDLAEKYLRDLGL